MLWNTTSHPNKDTKSNATEQTTQKWTMNERSCGQQKHASFIECRDTQENKTHTYAKSHTHTHTHTHTINTKPTYEGENNERKQTANKSTNTDLTPHHGEREFFIGFAWLVYRRTTTTINTSKNTHQHTDNKMRHERESKHKETHRRKQTTNKPSSASMDNQLFAIRGLR